MLMNWLKNIRKGVIEIDLITEDTLWTNCHGVTKKLKNLDDSHLSNLLHFLTVQGSFGRYELINVVKNIIKEKGLTEDFTNRSQIPYKNSNGNWEIWDFETNEPKEISA